jgi:hypothetical protein
MAAKDNLKTLVRNMTGREAFFGFLGPRGKRLAAGEEYELDGDPRQSFAGVTQGRKRRALLNALDNGDLVIVRTPPPLFYDETLDVTKTIKVNNNTVSATDPSWGAYSSSIGS